MDAGLIASLAVALSGAAAVGPVVLVTAFLASKGGRTNAAGFIAGYLGTYTTIALLLVASGLDVGRWTSGAAGPTGPIVLVILGIGLLVLGLRTARRPVADSVDLDGAAVDPAGERSRTPLLDRATPPRALGLGAAVAVVNVKNLALFLTAVAVLQTSRLTTGAKLAAAPLVALTFCLTAFVPLTIDVVAPGRSERPLAALRRGIERHGRRLARWLPWIVGAAFLARGVRGLV